MEKAKIYNNFVYNCLALLGFFPVFKKKSRIRYNKIGVLLEGVLFCLVPFFFTYVFRFSDTNTLTDYFSFIECMFGFD